MTLVGVNVSFLIAHGNLAGAELSESYLIFEIYVG